MNQRDRVVTAFILLVISILVGFDLFTDAREGVDLWHVLIEASIAIVALFGFFYILHGSYNLKSQLQVKAVEYSNLQKEAELWKIESRKYIDGLSKSIDQQLSKWKLSTAEKEVAFLLLKGMSLKEIANIRNTAEKTAKAQSLAVYAKSGLAGRSELSAFFLEDLLSPDIERDNPAQNQRHENN